MIFNGNSKILLHSWLKVYFLIFYKWSYSQRCSDVAQRFGNRRWKWQQCFDVVWHCSNHHWNRQRWFDDVQRCNVQRRHTPRCFNVDFWHFLELQRHGNLRTTLKQRWNVCWAYIFCLIIRTYLNKIFGQKLFLISKLFEQS